MSGAGIRIVGRRARRDWLILSALAATVLVAASLLAAGPIYAEAVSSAGLRATLTSAPVADAGVDVSARVRANRVAAVDSLVQEVLANLDTGVPSTTVGLARSDSLVPPERLDLGEGALALAGTREGLRDRVDLTTGRWPEAAGEAVAPAGALAAMGVEVGAVIDFETAGADARMATLEVVGAYQPLDAGDRYWWADTLATTGVTAGEQFTTYGPFVMTPSGFAATFSDDIVDARWHLLPAHDQLTTATATQLERAVAVLEGRLDGALEEVGVDVVVDTGLGGRLAGAQRSLQISRAVVTALTAQISVLAVYALLLTAGLLVESRDVETQLLRARGADTRQLTRLTALEGLLVVVPGVVLGPAVAAAGLPLLERFGPLVGSALDLRPTVGWLAAALAAVTGLVCLAVLILPARRAGRTYMRARTGRGRQSTRGALQRNGLDVALVLLAVVGLWQLRRYGAPLTRGLRGDLGVDPLLVLVPTIGLLAGGVLALRVVPLVARTAERLAGRRHGAVGPLGSRQVARRSRRYAGASLLLTLAVAVGLFGSSFARTWAGSQHDQAAFQVGAEVRVRPPPPSVSDIPPPLLSGTYASLPGVTGATPVSHPGIAVAGAANVTLVALDAQAAQDAWLVRDDLVQPPPRRALEMLASTRPELPAIEVPDATTALTLDLTVTREQADGIPDASPSVASRIDVAVLVRDGAGVLHRLSAGRFAAGPDQVALEAPLRQTVADSAGGLSGPLGLVAVVVDARPGISGNPAATVTVHRLAARTDGDRLVALAADDWTLHLEDVAGLQVPPSGEIASADPLRASLMLGDDTDAPLPSISFRLVPGTLESVESVPVLASRTLLDQTGHDVGERVVVRVDGTSLPVDIVGVMSAVPTLGADTPAVVADRPTLAVAQLSRGGNVRPPDAWLLALDEGASSGQETVATLRGTGGLARQVTARSEVAAGKLADPLALGVLGALAAGFVAALVVAVIGFASSATVSARDRAGEFALLQALGLSDRQLTRTLVVEHGFAVVGSLVGGIALGAGLAWLTLPSLTLSPTAVAVVPPPQVVVPWLTAVALAAGAVALLLSLPVMLARTLRRVHLASVLRLGEEAR